MPACVRFLPVSIHSASGTRRHVADGRHAAAGGRRFGPAVLARTSEGQGQLCGAIVWRSSLCVV